MVVRPQYLNTKMKSCQMPVLTLQLLCAAGKKMIISRTKSRDDVKMSPDTEIRQAPVINN